MKLLSLFSGIGAFEKALQRQNIPYTLVGFSEVDKYPATAYSVIHGVDEDLNFGDVCNINIANIPHCDMITYGFPCQDISIAGKQQGIIKNKTRSGLLFEALRIIEGKRPKYAIAENVKNLICKRYKDDFCRLLHYLDRIGYNSYWNVLNAKNFGIPQNRERVFIISVRKDIDTGKFEFPKPFDSGLRLKNLLEGKVDGKYYVDQSVARQLFIPLQVTEKTRNNLLQVGYIRKNQQGMRVYSPEGIAVTQNANGGGWGAKTGLYKVRSRVRRLSPLECWRLMGFDDEDYWKTRRALEKTFYNGRDRSDTRMYKMAGNSIVVPVVEKIFKQLFEGGA